jgi:glycosidase
MAGVQLASMRRPQPPAEFHVARTARDRYGIDEPFVRPEGTVVLPDPATARRFAAALNAMRPAAGGDGRPVEPGELYAMGLIHEILHHIARLYAEEAEPAAFETVLATLDERLGREAVDRILSTFEEAFPTAAAYRGEPAEPPDRTSLLEELLLLWLENANPAFEPFGELFADGPLVEVDYEDLIHALATAFEDMPAFGPDAQPLVTMLRSPAVAAPDSLEGQLTWIRERWGALLGAYLDRLLTSLDVLREEEVARWRRFHPAAGDGGGTAAGVSFSGLDDEPERYSVDSDWMPRLVLIAKSTYVWLDQLSRRYGIDIRRLDEVPDEELDTLARYGITGLWLIGVWQRSLASERIKRMRGNPEAVASAYSLDDYRIADDLGGEAGYENLRSRAWRRGIRLASDMVPNHMGIDSRWVMEHPDWFLSLPDSPYPAYSFNGPDLSSDGRAVIQIEDHYWEGTDAAVVFRRIDRSTGEARFIYHGNDGTSMPWNDTAQLNYLRPDVREAVIQTILAVARRFPVIRFDAAMTLAKRHIERLWFPEPGSGGAIPSRAEHAMTRDAFNAAMPEEFWREVVDRVAVEVPDTLLLAEAFWLMEGYFVRTLGMHRVYNSAFMNMLRDEKNAEYRLVMRNTLEFDPEILKRYVNFMNNPDERTAVDQFGKGDKYFGVATLMITMPGLPMLGHGQIEGYTEKYGMEYRRAYFDEQPDPWLVARHEHDIFPLLHRRRQFAEVRDFLLYDFVTFDGSVNEDVFAYSNGAGPDRSLVVYHNRYAETSGTVRDSVAYSVPSADGSRHLARRPLAEGLGLSRDPAAWVIFRDLRSGLEHLRSAPEIHHEGLRLSLDAYRTHVFADFRDVVDGPARQWARLAERLGGRPVPSVEAALAELQLEPVHEALRALLAGGALARLVDAASAAEPTRPTAGGGATRKAARARADDLATVQAAETAFLDAVRDATGTQGDPREITVAATARLVAILGLARLDVGRARTRRELAMLFGWALLEPMGALAPDAMVGPTSRAWFDELRLGPVIAGILRDVGLSEEEAWGATEALRTLLALPRASNIGRPARRRAERLLDAWLSHPDARPSIRVNRWEGVEWFGAEEFDQLVERATTLDIIDLLAADVSVDRRTGTLELTPSAKTRRRASEARRFADDLRARALASGYRTDALRAAFGEAEEAGTAAPSPKRSGRTEEKLDRRARAEGTGKPGQDRPQRSGRKGRKKPSS